MTALTVDSFAELSISADSGEIRRASAWLEQIGLERSVPAEQIGRLDLCLNEALANIIAHGGPAALAAPVHLQFRVCCGLSGYEAGVTVTDTGIAFDPLAYQQRPRPQTLAEAEPGGLGIMMMVSFADDISYCYSEGHNQLAFKVRWGEAS